VEPLETRLLLSAAPLPLHPSASITSLAAAAEPAVQQVNINGGQQADESSAIRIMTLGDSITDGSNGNFGGFRGYLQDLLINNGYVGGDNHKSSNINFVGNLAAGPALTPDGNMLDPDHQGYPGFNLGQLITALDVNGSNTILSAAQPDVILLMAGTNDMASDLAFNTAMNNGQLDLLINDIYTALPAVKLVVSNLIPIRNDPVKLDRVVAFNHGVVGTAQPDGGEGVVANYADRGKDILFVDMFSLFTDDLAQPPYSPNDIITSLYDNDLHPNDVGYEKIADTWFKTLVQTNSWLGIPLDPYETGRGDDVAQYANQISKKGKSQPHNIHQKTDVDWVKFRLYRKSNVIIKTNGVEGGDTRLRLFGINHKHRRAPRRLNDHLSGTCDSKIVRRGQHALQRGVYWVKVDGRGQTVRDYTIKVNAWPVHKKSHNTNNQQPLAGAFNGSEQIQLAAWNQTLNSSGKKDELQTHIQLTNTAGQVLKQAETFF